jgi:2'-5' RNA ligase
MAHAIEMFFDDHADAAVRKIWDLLAAHGLPSLATRTHRRHRPHVSLTVTESMADADLAALRSVLTNRHPALHLHVLGMFPGDEGVLFLAPTVTADLLTFHTQVHAVLADQPIQHWPYYLPGNWVPHCTLAQGLDRDGRATAIRLLHDYQPIAATVTTIGITDTQTGDVTQLTP